MGALRRGRRWSGVSHLSVRIEGEAPEFPIRSETCPGCGDGVVPTRSPDGRRPGPPLDVGRWCPVGFDPPDPDRVLVVPLEYGELRVVEPAAALVHRCAGAGESPLTTACPMTFCLAAPGVACRAGDATPAVTHHARIELERRRDGRDRTGRDGGS